MGIELMTIGQGVVALANWAMANIGEKLKMAVYIHTYLYGHNTNPVKSKVQHLSSGSIFSLK